MQANPEAVGWPDDKWFPLRWSSEVGCQTSFDENQDLSVFGLLARTMMSVWPWNVLRNSQEWSPRDMVGLHGLQMRKSPTIQLSSSGLRILCSLEIRFGPFGVLEWIRPLIIAQYHQGKQFLAPHDHQIVGLVDFNGLGRVHWAEIQSLSN